MPSLNGRQKRWEKHPPFLRRSRNQLDKTAHVGVLFFCADGRLVLSARFLFCNAEFRGEEMVSDKFKKLTWLSPLYFIEGLPNAVVGTLSVGYYKSMGMDNSAIALLTSSLYLPWVLKGFWAPLVDSLSRKRVWILLCASVFFLCFLGLAAAQFVKCWVFLTASIFWLLGFASATFDISADGFYMLALPPKDQSFFVGVRNAFYRIAVLFGQGALMVVAGKGEELFGGVPRGWAVSFGVCSLVAGAAVPILFFALPKPESDKSAGAENALSVLRNMGAVFAEFFSRKHIGTILAFVLLYRFAEAQLLRVVQPFLLDGVVAGGLGMSTVRLGFIYGTVAPIALLGGGIIGGFLISKFGLAKMMMPMACAINLPNIIYVYMAYQQPQNDLLNLALISFEQFGYGLGFSSFMVFLMWASRGENKTANYAICTSLMALGIIIPGFLSAFLQLYTSYTAFFEWIMVSTVVSFAVTYFAVRLVKKSDAY